MRTEKNRQPRSESFVLLRLTNGFYIKKARLHSDEQRPRRGHGAGNLLLKDSQRFSSGLIDFVKHQGVIFYKVRIKF